MQDRFWVSDAGGMPEICRRKVIRFSYYTFSAARGQWKKNRGGCRRNCRTVAKAVREGGIGWIRAVGIVVRGDQTEASEAGQLDGPVPRGGTTRGPVRQIVEAWGVIPCHDYGGGWAEWCGAEGWLAGMGGWEAAGTDLSNLPFLRMRWMGCSVSAGSGEREFGVIVFGCGEVVGTITRNEARG